MPVGPRCMRIVAGIAGQETRSVPVLWRLDEIGVLLMVRLRVLAVTPEIGGRGVVTAGIAGQESGSACSGDHHLVGVVERGILVDPVGIVALGTAVALPADHVRPFGGDQSGGDDGLALAAGRHMSGAGSVAGLAPDVQFLLRTRHRVHFPAGIRDAGGHIFAARVPGDAVAGVVARRALEVETVRRRGCGFERVVGRVPPLVEVVIAPHLLRAVGRAVAPGGIELKRKHVDALFAGKRGHVPLFIEASAVVQGHFVGHAAVVVRRVGDVRELHFVGVVGRILIDAHRRIHGPGGCAFRCFELVELARRVVIGEVDRGPAGRVVSGRELRQARSVVVHAVGRTELRQVLKSARRARRHDSELVQDLLLRRIRWMAAKASGRSHEGRRRRRIGGNLDRRFRGGQRRPGHGRPAEASAGQVVRIGPRRFHVDEIHVGRAGREAGDDRLARGDQFLKEGTAQDAALQVPVLLLEGTEPEDLPEQQEKRLHGKGLRQVILGAALHRLHRGFDAAVPGHHDHRRRGDPSPGFPQHLHAVLARQPEIGHHHVEPFAVEPPDRFDPVVGPGDGESRPLQRVRHREAEAGVVLYDQDPFPFTVHGPLPAQGQREERCGTPSPRPGGRIRRSSRRAVR